MNAPDPSDHSPTLIPPVPAAWSLLLVEDDEDDFLITKTLLHEVPNQRIQVEWARSCEEARQQVLAKNYDVLLVDYRLGDGNGLDLIREINHHVRQVPMILLTGMGSYEIDLEAMRAGAVDFLAKGEMSARMLERAIRYAIERKQTEQSLLRMNDQLAEAKNALEQRVRERTQELRKQTEDLEAEIGRRIRLEAELADVQSLLIDRSESERLEIAQELHDGPVQELYGLAFGLTAMESDSLRPDQREEVQQLNERVNFIIRALRSLAQELRPPALAPFGLEKAIRSHAEAFQQAHPEMKIRTHLEPDEQRLPERSRLALFRIYQNAMANIVRHSAADTVDVHLDVSESQVVLEVCDNGRGFVVPERWYEFAREGHLGLVGSVERAEAIGGTLEVSSEPGRGTKVRVSVPVPEPVAQQE